jgi:RHS repeat-associated protein
LLNPTTVNPSFVVDKPGIYSIQLVVNDGQTVSEAAIVLVTTLNARPVANAGNDQGGRVNDLITLDGSSSNDVDGDALTYTWSLLTKPVGSSATLNDPTIVKPNFTLDKPGVYIAQLIVHDPESDSEPDTVIVTTENSKPVANPGPDQTVALNALVRLDGTGSSDPDNDQLAYQWSFVNKPANSTATLNNANTTTPSFIVNKAGNYVLELVVNDGKLNSLPTTVTVSTLNSRPVADAGPDQIASQSLILLDATGSNDADEDLLTYQWALLSKPVDSRAVLDDPLSSQPRFTADLPGYYVSQLIVNDGKMDSNPDTVAVEVPSILFNHPPEITSEPPLLGQVGQQYSYDVNASDADISDVLVYRLSTAPEGMTIDSATGVIKWSPSLEQLGEQAATVKVIDSYGVEASQTFNISVSALVTTLTVPDVVGMSRANAEIALRGANLATGIITLENSNTVSAGQVIRTSPDSNTIVGQGATVDLVVSLGPNAPGLPPDPVAIAPDLNPTASFTPLQQATEFLYSDANPVQTSVNPSSFDAKRIAIIRGKVLGRNNEPLVGVKLNVKGHPEYGQTLSRVDGQFDLAVNGGGYLTLNYQKDGFLPIQRQVNTPWQDYVITEDAVMIQLDSQVTEIALSSGSAQVAQGSISSDEDGQRQATILFPANTQATMTLADGSIQALANVHVRATEYSIGANGPKTMPGLLPPTSGYTYAVELSVDEAMSAGAKKVAFSQPIPVYVDNFLGFPVGESVPAGWYDPEKTAWIPSNNGKVIKITAIANGLATVDSNGDNAPDTAAQLTALGITAAEQAKLATLFPAGKTLWRVPVTHFTPWDFNWPAGPPPDSEPPPEPEQPKDPPPDEDSDECEGCSINAQAGTVGEKIDVIGTPYKLHYQSRRSEGYGSDRSIKINLSGASLPSKLKGIDVKISIAGKTFTKSFPAEANQTFKYDWDGTDGYNRHVTTDTAATITVSNQYNPVYYSSPAAFTQSFAQTSTIAGGTFIGGRNASTIGLARTWKKTISGKQPEMAVGNLSISTHHKYDNTQLLLGTGKTRKVNALDNLINTVAGNGAQLFSGDGGLATEASLSNPFDVVLDAQGNLFISDLANGRIRKVSPNGIITTVAGNGLGTVTGDGGPSTQAAIGNNRGISLGPDGSLYIADTYTGHRIRRISPDGIITTVAGNGQSGTPNGDGNLATLAKIGDPQDVAVDKDGTIFICDSGYDRIRRVSPSGIISTYAGTGISGFGGDGGPATKAIFNNPTSIALGQDGSLYIMDSGNNRIRKVLPSGIISTIAGNGSSLVSGEHLAVDIFDNIYVSNNTDAIIQMVSPNGTITTLAGIGTSGFSGDGGLPLQAQIDYPVGIAVDVTGAVYFSDLFVQRIRRISPSFVAINGSNYGVTSENGKFQYHFDKFGRHLSTVSTYTGTTVTTFGYDSKGSLTQIKDVDGNLTRIERDNLGNPVVIIAPDGQRTQLETDAAGRVIAATNAAKETHRLSYTSSGLMTSFSDRKGSPSTQFQYDANGRLKIDRTAALGGWGITRTEDSKSYTHTMTTAEGRALSFKVATLSNGERQQVKTQPDGTVQTKLFKPNGEQTITSTNGALTTIKKTTDPRFGMQAPILGDFSIKMPSGLTSTATKNRTVERSNPIDLLSMQSLTDKTVINGKTYTSTFNKAALSSTKTSPQGRSVTRQLNAKGRTVQATVANFAPINYQYDNRGRLIQLEQGAAPDTRTSQISYNPQGYVATLTDPLNNVTGFEYDLAGRVTRQILPDNREVNYSYDANGNLASLTPPGRPPHVFSHTPVNLTQDYTAPTAGLGNTQTVYEYNKDKQLTKITRPDLQVLDFNYSPTTGKLSTLSLPTGDYSYQYSPTNGKLASVTAPDGGKLSYSYDGMLLKDSAWTGTITGSVNRTYNSDFNITEIKVNGATPITFQYDNDRLLTRAGNLILARHAQNGLLASSTLGVVSDLYGYNAFGEMASYTAKGNGADVFATTYTRDALGRIKSKQETVLGVQHTEDYTYDTAGRLTGVKRDGNAAITYGYDQNGNRTAVNGQTVATYDDQDRLTSYTPIAPGSAERQYAYTENGELKAKTVGTSTTAYDYDLLGNLKKVTFDDGNTVDYLTDGQNRRIGKKINGTLVQGWLYQDGLRPIAELDGNNQVTARFIYGSKTNVPDYMTKGGATYRIISDHLGSPRLVIDTATNTIVQEMAYDVWGNVTKDTSPGFQPFGFAGGQYDNDTKLVRFGARDYDAQTGRWTAKDPILFKGGDKNLYGYLANDPVDWVDPNGLDKHHVFPREFWKKSGMSKEVKKIFNNEIVNTPGPHNNTRHPPYSKRAGQLFDEFCKNYNIDPNDISPDMAEEFLEELKNDPEIDEFNRAQEEGAPLPIVHPLWEVLLALPYIAIDIMIENNASD